MERQDRPQAVNIKQLCVALITGLEARLLPACRVVKHSSFLAFVGCASMPLSHMKSLHAHRDCTIMHRAVFKQLTQPRLLPLPLSWPDRLFLAQQLLWAEGGVRRFYRGFTPCLIRAAPANGAMLYTVDTVTNWLNKQSH